MFEAGARPHPPRELYRAYLEQSDVFVGVYGESYGGVPPGEEVSGLEDEYLRSGDMPKLVYVKHPAPEREPRLVDLLAPSVATTASPTRGFASAQELGGLVADDLAVLLSDRFGAAERDGVAGEPRSPPRPRRSSGVPVDIARLERSPSWVTGRGSSR